MTQLASYAKLRVANELTQTQETLMEVEVTALTGEPYRQVISTGGRTFFADVPPDKGGNDTAPSPHELFLGSWGACTAMTVQMYANRKGWPLQGITVTLSEHTENRQSRIEKTIQLQGPLSDEQAESLKAIAEKCPVNRLITGEIDMQVHFERLP